MHGKFPRRVNGLRDGSDHDGRGSGRREYSVKAVLRKRSLFRGAFLEEFNQNVSQHSGRMGFLLGCSLSLKFSSGASSSETRSLGCK